MVAGYVPWLLRKVVPGTSTTPRLDAEHYHSLSNRTCCTSTVSTFTLNATSTPGSTPTWPTRHGCCYC